jgi:hypothetical protein
MNTKKKGSEETNHVVKNFDTVMNSRYILKAAREPNESIKEEESTSKETLSKTQNLQNSQKKLKLDRGSSTASGKNA